nr:MAG TPA: hypothetical protein [Caudoviricetes sp.]
MSSSGVGIINVLVRVVLLSRNIKLPIHSLLILFISIAISYRIS